jgi:CheY-like chemotaxis protein/ribosomal protein S27E
MSEPRARILIVDDKSGVRTTVSDVLCEIGFHVRTAKDGYSALREIRRETPDILLSDLHMPGMSGFELLSVVRRRFPSILVIAMSGAFAGDEVPSGVPADGFFQKGCSTGALLQILTAPPRMKRHDPRLSGGAPPDPIQRIESASSSDGWYTIACPDCRRTATQALHGVGSFTCVHCGNSIEYAIVEPSGQTQASQHRTSPASYVQNAHTLGG